MTNIRRHLTFANAIAAIALFVARRHRSEAPLAVVDTHGHLVRGSGAVSAKQSLRTSAAHIR